MSISGVGNSNNTYNVTQPGTTPAGTPNAPASSTGAGGLNSTGGPLPQALPTYAPPPALPQLTDADLALLAKALETSGGKAGTTGFDYQSVVSMLGALMIEQVGHQRTQAMNQRTAGYQSAQASSLQQANEMKNAANEMDKGAVKNMAIGITTAGVAMIGSSVSFAKQLASIKPAANAMQDLRGAQKTLDAVTAKADTFSEIGAKVPTKLQNQVENAQAAFKVAASQSTEIEKSAQRFQTMADLTGRVGDIGRQLGSGLDAKDQAQAKRYEAEGATDAAEATAQQQRADMGKEVQQALDDLLSKIQNFISEMKQNEIEMMRVISR